MIPRESAGGIIATKLNNGEERIVLVEQHHNSWSFPKGGIETDEEPLDAAKREIFEETGLSELTLRGELGSYERYSLGVDGKSENKEWGLRKRTFFLFTSEKTAFRAEPHDEEITAMRWVSIDEALALLTHPKDREFLQSVRARVESALK